MLRTCGKICLLTRGKFVFRAEGEGYIPQSGLANFPAGTYYILHDEVVVSEISFC